MTLSDIALEFLGRGGKRLRPRLCHDAFLAAGGAAGDARIRALEEAVECFHKASLIHDDIQDGDEQRYGRPTVWKEQGVALAIAAGDWLVARGYQLIVQSGFPNVAGLLAATVDSHRALCEGQGEDLLMPPHPAAFDRRRYIATCERKTGEAFALAAQLGALAAGKDDRPFRQFGLSFGVLFQIEDDLADGEREDLLATLRSTYRQKARACAAACSLSGMWAEF